MKKEQIRNIGNIIYIVGAISILGIVIYLACIDPGFIIKETHNRVIDYIIILTGTAMVVIGAITALILRK